jgi:hypothetical protein
LRLRINRPALCRGGILQQGVDIPGLVDAVDLLLPDMAAFIFLRGLLTATAGQQHRQHYRILHHRLHCPLL